MSTIARISQKVKKSLEEDYGFFSLRLTIGTPVCVITAVLESGEKYECYITNYVDKIEVYHWVDGMGAYTTNIRDENDSDNILHDMSVMFRLWNISYN